MPEMRPLLLVDNGSLEPAATLSLRCLAAALSERLGRPVVPLSLLHSHKVDPELLGGLPAQILEPWLRSELQKGVHSFDLQPLFFGPSGAITDYLPARLERLRESWPELELQVGPFLSELRLAGGWGLTDLLVEQVRSVLRPPCKPWVLLVDHGSPKPEVCAVRNRLGEALAVHLGTEVQGVSVASMERRPEPEYAFNEPLLERALPALPESVEELVVALLFLSPGRHAGPGGDIEQICAAAQVLRPKLRVRFTPLVGTHPGLIALLGSSPLVR